MTDKKDAFLAISTPQELANLLDISYSKYIIYYLYRAPLEHLYFKFNIPKRSGDTREITAPKSGLKLIQKKLSEYLILVYPENKCAHGFLPNRSITSNAEKHVRKSWVLKIDIQDFFPSIHFGRVRGLFMAKPY